MEHGTVEGLGHWATTRLRPTPSCAHPMGLNRPIPRPLLAPHPAMGACREEGEARVNPIDDRLLSAACLASGAVKVCLVPRSSDEAGAEAS
eukprot:CAMPEP_0174349592 /NCGR_PEP_ID=MMETSP0811_2-20130205/6353_1 /TAXON_ID=73025 ORGANISM="Eutreptiella gymnastica-like, Strain CCMP1594" /NCGR_SAMPLE_ID=MMETSP0811_2 /ASSEMBLY_ACC=CAM_ASM_000667 /LENGTH=90 /DNA_ID=CAMNT_0015477085 /DNA_START=501 /DNA_END=770 /DNA_ORIENTATION=-